MGRTRKQPDDPSLARPRNVKTTDQIWSDLERIAAHHGLEWAGVPSRSEALRQAI